MLWSILPETINAISGDISFGSVSLSNLIPFFTRSSPFFSMKLLAISVFTKPGAILKANTLSFLPKERVIVFVSDISYEIRGSDNIPKSGSFVVACNHQSAWETFFFGSIFPGSVFILKYELEK